MLSQLMNVDINGNIKEDEKEDDTVNGPWSELRLDWSSPALASSTGLLFSAVASHGAWRCWREASST